MDVAGRAIKRSLGLSGLCICWFHFWHAIFLAPVEYLGMVAATDYNDHHDEDHCYDHAYVRTRNSPSVVENYNVFYLGVVATQM